MNIRTAKNEDVETLVKMGEQLHFVEKEFEPLLTFSKEEARRRYTSELTNPNSLILVAEEDLTPIGYLYSHAEKVEYFNTDKLECEIEVVFVSEEFRGQGVAQLLIEKCLEWAKTKNMLRIKTGIYAQNSSSQSVFAKVGFVPYHITYIL
jgi:GNAT superfamily N-acetyltransferase